MSDWPQDASSCSSRSWLLPLPSLSHNLRFAFCCVHFVFVAWSLSLFKELSGSSGSQSIELYGFLLNKIYTYNTHVWVAHPSPTFPYFYLSCLRSRSLVVLLLLLLCFWPYIAAFGPVIDVALATRLLRSRARSLGLPKKLRPNHLGGNQSLSQTFTFHFALRLPYNVSMCV